MLETAHESFGGAFATIPLGIKIPGVHWQMAATASHPRIAEIAAGQIRTSVDYTGGTSGHGYGATIAIVHRFHNARAVNLHFTALETDNWEDTHTCQIDASQAKALVFWVAAADADQVNALAGGVTSDHGWDNIENVFKWASYNGLTVLRIGEVTDNPSARPATKDSLPNRGFFPIRSHRLSGSDRIERVATPVSDVGNDAKTRRLDRFSRPLIGRRCGGGGRLNGDDHGWRKAAARQLICPAQNPGFSTGVSSSGLR